MLLRKKQSWADWAKTIYKRCLGGFRIAQYTTYARHTTNVALLDLFRLSPQDHIVTLVLVKGKCEAHVRNDEIHVKPQYPLSSLWWHLLQRLQTSSWNFSALASVTSTGRCMKSKLQALKAVWSSALHCR